MRFRLALTSALAVASSVLCAQTQNERRLFAHTSELPADAFVHVEKGNFPSTPPAFFWHLIFHHGCSLDFA